MLKTFIRDTGSGSAHRDKQMLDFIPQEEKLILSCRWLLKVGLKVNVTAARPLHVSQTSCDCADRQSVRVSSMQLSHRPLLHASCCGFTGQ